MKKRKVKKITLEFADGTTDTFEVDATISESLNSRKKYGFQNIQEWVEYHITWVTYVQDLPLAVKKIEKPEHRQEEAWCSQHECSPSECFKVHNVKAYSGRERTWASPESAVKFLELPVDPPWLKEFTDFLEGYGNGKH